MAKKVASQNIEISTEQNVVLSYELGTVFQRYVAGLVDSVIIWGLSLIRLAIFPSVSGLANLVGFTLLFIWLYHLLVILFFGGRSIGMRAMGLRVVSLSGKSLEFSDYFLRWIIRPIDISISATSVGLFSMLSSEKRQRLGDILAGTAVVKLQPKSHFTLRDILEFHQTKEVTEVRYPGVKYMEEANMLFIKNLLNNNLGYSPEVQREAIYQATLKFAELLQLETIPNDNRGFLVQLVNDYIVLTR